MTYKQRKIFYPVIFFTGIILMYFQIEVFRNTMIHWLIPTSVLIVAGILCFLVDFKNFEKTYVYPLGGTKFYGMLHYLIGFGCIACSIFMMTNYYFADQNIKTESYKIVDSTSIRGTKKYSFQKEKPVFTINYKGQNKEFIFYSEFFDKMNQYKTVEFSVRKGFFGFDIVQDKKLK